MLIMCQQAFSYILIHIFVTCYEFQLLNGYKQKTKRTATQLRINEMTAKVFKILQRLKPKKNKYLKKLKLCSGDIEGWGKLQFRGEVSQQLVRARDSQVSGRYYIMTNSLKELHKQMSQELKFKNDRQSWVCLCRQAEAEGLRG